MGNDNGANGDGTGTNPQPDQTPAEGEQTNA